MDEKTSFQPMEIQETLKGAFPLFLTVSCSLASVPCEPKDNCYLLISILSIYTWKSFRETQREEYSHMKNKVEDVQVSHEIRKQVLRSMKIKPWCGVMMMLHITNDGRCLMFFGQASAFSSWKHSRRQTYGGKLGRTGTWLIILQS